jgi:hypothetical protein
MNRITSQAAADQKCAVGAGTIRDSIRQHKLQYPIRAADACAVYDLPEMVFLRCRVEMHRDDVLVWGKLPGGPEVPVKRLTITCVQNQETYFYAEVTNRIVRLLRQQRYSSSTLPISGKCQAHSASHKLHPHALRDSLKLPRGSPGSDMFLSAWMMTPGLMKNVSDIVSLLSLFAIKKQAKQSR